MQGDVVLTIDPGLGGTGVVAWDMNDWHNDLRSMNFQIQRFNMHTKEWTIGSADIVADLKRWAHKMNVVKMYVEFPQAFQSAVGQSAINRGDIFKLSFLIGCIRGAFPYAAFEPVRVVDWKGQLPKEICIKRIKRLIPPEKWPKSTHEYDAIGIGLYLKGKF